MRPKGPSCKPGCGRTCTDWVPLRLQLICLLSLASLSFGSNTVPVPFVYKELPQDSWCCWSLVLGPMSADPPRSLSQAFRGSSSASAVSTGTETMLFGVFPVAPGGLACVFCPAPYFLFSLLDYLTGLFAPFLEGSPHRSQCVLVINLWLLSFKSILPSLLGPLNAFLCQLARC